MRHPLLDPGPRAGQARRQALQRHVQPGPLAAKRILHLQRGRALLPDRVRGRAHLGHRASGLR